MIVLRLVFTATSLTAVALVFGTVALVCYAELNWLRHGVWPDIRLVHLFHWARINPSIANRFGISGSLQWPLWICLVGPGIVLGWISATCGRRLRRYDEARRAPLPPRRDAA